MSTLPVETREPQLSVVDLSSVRVFELEGFFRRELQLWRDRLSWDVSPAIAAFRRALDRGGVQGKAVRCGSSVAASGYFLIESSRAVLTGVAVAPEWRGAEVGPILVRALLRELMRRGVLRIESQFVSFDAPWLAASFESEGFESFTREFRRLSLPTRTEPEGAPDTTFVHRSWKPWNLSEASSIMQSAHATGVDARMNELYRSSEGCRALLTSVLRHRGCGAAIAEASIMARDAASDRAAGFAVVTETSHRKAHLAQLAVAPSYQGAGLGRRILSRVTALLSGMAYESLSLMVSRDNERARELYRSLGFELVLSFPVFCRDRRS
jgi:ribosomal protein S18 acetylase RimI-like enzyme